MDSADAFVKGALTVGAIYLFFLGCRALWALITSSVSAAMRAYEKLPDAMEQTARVTGKAVSDASSLGKKLKKEFDEGRIKNP
ncbi:MAG: hypothetical protein ACSLFL_00340 [Alphaproteobacteria bacterium]